uniref:Uncharacterized protein n=1 Tax=viral metagenome TaxID=1070528 RepID=A0A6H1ZE46_9ZZZZ
MPEPIEEPTPDLRGCARLGRLRELNSRLQKLVATGLSIHADDPGMIAALFTRQEQAGVLAIAERVKARLDVIEKRMDNVDTT